MKSLNKIIFTLVFIALAAGAYYYYQQSSKKNPADVYRLAEITQGDIEQTVSANGTLNPVTLVSVGTQVSGIVKKLYVDFNDVVKKDQVLLELDNALFMAQISQSQASVRNNQASVELAQANEKRIREFTAELANKKESIASSSVLLKERLEDLDRKKRELEEITSETQIEEERLKAKSEKIEGNIEPRLLTAFKRIRKNARNGLAVVTVQRDACGGCFNKIPPQRQMDIASRKKVIVCEYCGRILVDKDILDSIETGE